MDGYRRLARLFKALAHPVRLQILDELGREGEACVCHLEHALGQRQACISQHLSRLREGGFVVDRRDGLNVFYALSDASIESLLAEARAIVQERASTKLAFRPASGRPRTACPCPRCARRPPMLTSESVRRPRP
jgi:ArsR family transcriptional regulator